MTDLIITPAPAKREPGTFTLTREDDHCLRLECTFLAGDDGTKTAALVRQHAETVIRALARQHGLLPVKREHGQTAESIVAILTFDGTLPQLTQPRGTAAHRRRP